MSYTDRTRYAGGAIGASLWAGPVFILSGAIVFAGRTADPIVPDLGSLSPMAILLVPLVILAGFILSIVPIIIGGAALSSLGRHNEGARLPVFWGIVGGISAAGVALASDFPGEVIATIAMTGAACALICRRGTIWP